MRRAFGLMTFVAAPPLLCAAQLPRDAFAFGLPIVTSSAAAAYRLVVPPAVYRGTLRADLGDIQVFNGDGAVVASLLQ